MFVIGLMVIACPITIVFKLEYSSWNGEYYRLMRDEDYGKIFNLLNGYSIQVISLNCFDT